RSVAAELGCAALEWERIPATSHDVLVHCTPVGSAGAPPGSPDMAIPADWLRPGTLVLDAVYRPVKTALLAAARERGCTAVPGAEWFVRQATAQFRLFTAHDADEALLRAAFESALRE
ncbi:MAG TPA: hypothetical protein VMS76_18090, partial [Planctomycetota bacterium]|nr:hypothetical protein [Planctomycetota bacterium]